MSRPRRRSARPQASTARPTPGDDTGAPDRAARHTLRVLMLLVLSAWILDLPGAAGLALYTEQLLALVVGLAAALVLLGEPDGPHATRWRGRVLAAATLGVFTLTALAYPRLQATMVPATPLTVILCVCMLGAVLEATRRRLGLFLPMMIMALGMLVLAGPWLPAGLELRALTASRLVVYLGLDSNALLGRILAVAAVVVVPFVVFGALFGGLGGAERLATLAATLVGDRRGGTAKVSVAGSAAFGMVSGSAVANVVTVGSVSIPMMVRAGYPRHIAGAIEALGSTGGQLMPPVMGASAFLMAEFLQLSYRSVVLAALLPALMFYAAVWLAVDFEARRANRPRTEAVPLAAHTTSVPGARLLMAALLLFYLLFVAGWSTDQAAGTSVLTLIALYLPGPRGSLGERIGRVARALAGAMDAAADIVLIGAAAGLVIGLLNLSGLAFALTLQTLHLGHGSLASLLLATAALSLLLGLGMPTVGVYALLATLLAPALVELAVPPLAAHLYVLYFGMFSMITPPIAIASFAAAALSGADPLRTSLASLQLGAGIYLVPVAFVLQPELLLLGDPGDTLLAALRLLLAVILMTAAALGHAGRALPAWLRVLAALLALANILPGADGALDARVWLALAAGLGLLPALLPRRTVRR